jgi:hypothetical protein
VISLLPPYLTRAFFMPSGLAGVHAIMLNDYSHCYTPTLMSEASAFLLPHSRAFF